MIAFLSGGTGTPKLIAGARRLIKDESITVIVNTAEDMWYQGGFLSPDIDTVLYLFAGVLDREKWWGIANDSFVTHTSLLSFGVDAYLTLGDRDRATTIARAELLRNGLSLTGATRELSRQMGISAEILPMSDTPVASMIDTPSGTMHFQHYWVKHKGNLPITKVRRVSEQEPDATKEVMDALTKADLVVIGPSNPITSILPILSCTGVTEALQNKPVVAVSPFIGDEPVSGPAKDLMIASGAESNSRGVASLYREFVTTFIQDVRDSCDLPGSVRYDTLMKDEMIAADLMRCILSCASRYQK